MMRFCLEGPYIPDPGMPEIAIKSRSELGIVWNLSYHIKDRNHRESDPEVSEEKKLLVFAHPRSASPSLTIVPPYSLLDFCTQAKDGSMLASGCTAK